MSLVGYFNKSEQAALRMVEASPLVQREGRYSVIPKMHFVGLNLLIVASEFKVEIESLPAKYRGFR